MSSIDYSWDEKTYTIYVGDRDFSFKTENMTAIEKLAQFTKIMEYADAIGDDEFVDRLEDWVSDIAEDAEVMFTYNRKGKARVYTPASMWEASGSCTEWEESAQYGLDYGWGI